MPISAARTPPVSFADGLSSTTLAAQAIKSLGQEASRSPGVILLGWMPLPLPLDKSRWWCSRGARSPGDTLAPRLFLSWSQLNLKRRHLTRYCRGGCRCRFSLQLRWRRVQGCESGCQSPLLAPHLFLSLVFSSNKPTRCAQIRSGENAKTGLGRFPNRRKQSNNLQKMMLRPPQRRRASFVTAQSGHRRKQKTPGSGEAAGGHLLSRQ